MSKYLEAIHSIAIQSNPRRSSDYYGYAELTTESGIVSVSAGRCDSIWIRGTPEAIISLGIIEPDWLPGLPGRGATAQTVYFEESGPWLPYGSNRKGRRPRCPRITIRAWGHITRTVDVQAPLSDSQRQICEALEEAASAQRKRTWVSDVAEFYDADGIFHPPPSCDRQHRPIYRAEGNVLYLVGAVRPPSHVD